MNYVFFCAFFPLKLQRARQRLGAGHPAGLRTRQGLLGMVQFDSCRTLTFGTSWPDCGSARVSSADEILGRWRRDEAVCLLWLAHTNMIKHAVCFIA